MKEIKAYQCDYCKRIYKSKQYMKKHEAMCFLNPENKTCWKCEHNFGMVPGDEFICSKFSDSIKEISKKLNLRYYEKQGAIKQCPYFELRDEHKCKYCKHSHRFATFCDYSDDSMCNFGNGCESFEHK